ncbi:MAG: LptF/LptG family permease, partial [Opitutaceae bacterium]
DSEITAMRSSGISLRRIARPVFVLGVLGGAGALYVNFESMPRARIRFHQELEAVLASNPLRLVEPNTFFRASGHGQDARATSKPAAVVYVGEINESLHLRDIWMWELDRDRRVTRVVRAEKGRLDYDLATKSLVPRLFNARTEERDVDNPEDFTKSPYAPAVQIAGGDFLRLPLERYQLRARFRPKQDWLTYGELRAEAVRLAALPAAEPKEKEERARQKMSVSLVLHDKFNLSLAVFSFAFLGVPLGIKASRRETSANLGLALVLVLSYYAVTIMVKWLDRHPVYRPDLLLWLPNILFIALGVWLLRRMERQ